MSDTVNWKKKKWKRTDWSKRIANGARVVRAGFDTYIGLKRKDPLYVASGLAGGVDAVVSLVGSNREDIDIDQEMRSRGLTLLYYSTHLCRFLYNTINHMDIPCEKMTISKKRVGGSYYVRVYELSEEHIFFLCDGPRLLGVYGEDRDTVLAAFGSTVRSKLGQFLSLSAFEQDWTPHMFLTTLDPKLDAYVSQFDIEEFKVDLEKFRARGLNRATILNGHPGTGKTTFANLLSQKMGERLLIIESSPLNKIMNAGFQLSTIVDICRPGIILFDDLDRVDRPLDLFGEVERLNRTKRDRSIVILSSINHLKNIPEPLRRPGRFDEILEFELPSEDLRRTILRSHLDSFGTRITNGNVDQVVACSEGLSGADLRELALQIDVRGFELQRVQTRCCNMLRLKNLGDNDKKSEEEENPVTFEKCQTVG